MAETNTSPSATLEPPEPVYFEVDADPPAIEDVVYGLHGVCNALHRESISGNMDFEKINRIANLACAANVLSKQLWARQTSGPPTRRRLRAV